MCLLGYADGTGMNVAYHSYKSMPVIYRYNPTAASAEIGLIERKLYISLRISYRPN